jgi:hypothetical protein
MPSPRVRSDAWLPLLSASAERVPMLAIVARTHGIRNKPMIISAE